MKKSDYGTLKTVIELRENGIIIDGPLNVRVLRGLSEFTEKVIPGGLMDPTPEDNQNGGFVIVPPKEGKKLGRGIDALFSYKENDLPDFMKSHFEELKKEEEKLISQINDKFKKDQDKLLSDLENILRYWLAGLFDRFFPKTTKERSQ